MIEQKERVIVEKQEHFQFISDDTLLEIKIAMYLDKQSRYVSTEELSEEFNLSSFSARKISRNLEQHIEEYNTEGYSIDISTSYGTKLNVPIESDLKLFFIFIMEHSPNIQLVKSIFQGEFKTVTQYALDHHLSEATVRRNLNSVRKLLGNLKIGISNKNFNLTGSEKQIRYFFLLFFWRINRGLVWPFKTVSEQSMKLIVEGLSEKEYVAHLSPIEKKRLMFLLAITKIRINSNNHVEYDEIFLYSENYEKLKSDLVSLNYLSNLSRDEFYFMYQLFKGFAWFNNLSGELEFEEEHLLPAGVANVYTFNKIKHVLSNISVEQTKVEKEFLYSIHVLAHEFHNFSTDINGYDYTRLMNLHAFNLEQKIIKFIQTAKQQTHLSLYEEQKFLVPHYIMLLANVSKNLSFEKEIMVYLETALPKAIENFLVEQIKNYFRSRYNIKFFKLGEKIDEERVDVFLTTIPLDEYNEIYKNAQIIAINRELHFADYAKIEEALLNCLKKKQ
ncbi:helix-turn-helix domain-containing protein [Carnobacterium divergens]|uniref:helix-turn-helix domain-containing protein n=1 Tax=Carnobacterium divergens TaxID=2748 RepID=UPI001072B08C|nr:helix-turn-helix domain-containing protein [Carnobacterium divergens]MCO6016956.1 helix-turn-helix domain-containing protein [Carnobacterium divergens]MPQ22575.1 hypothetical protein [Carnobacterium divergens]